MPMFAQRSVFTAGVRAPGPKLWITWPGREGTVRESYHTAPRRPRADRTMAGARPESRRLGATGGDEGRPAREGKGARRGENGRKCHQAQRGRDPDVVGEPADRRHAESACTPC